MVMYFVQVCMRIIDIALLEQLFPYQPFVISDLVYGADIWAHKQALEIRLTTVAVLPTASVKCTPQR